MSDMHRMRIFVVLGWLIAAVGAQESKYGRDVITSVTSSLCWYEFLMKSKTDVNQFLRCDNQIHKIRKGYMGVPDVVYGGALSNTLPEWFPNYMRECDEYLKTPHRPYKNGIEKSNYGFVIGEERYYRPYPFQAFAHCLVAEVDKSNGLPGLLALETRLKGERYWRETMYRRENEFRSRHNVSSLELDTLLTEEAQVFAQQLAASCSFKPSNPLSRERLYNRQFTGENIAMNGGTYLRDEDAANVAVTGWYEEMANYDFATGASKNNFPVDQFTQSVWKGTERVGYGLGVNKKCPNGYTHYVVARYYPAGNIPANYLVNVLPPVSEP